MKLRLSFSIIISFFILILFSINTFADNNNNDVFNNYSFPQKGFYAQQLSDGIGSTKFREHYIDPGYKNKVTVNSTGEKNVNGNKENYIEFVYGSEGGPNKDQEEKRYVNFQMELSNQLRFNDRGNKSEAMVDGNNTNITYRGQNKKVIKLQDMHMLNTNGRKIYSYDFYPGNYHSGTVTVRLYLKPNISYENSYNRDGDNPLINLYYRSGSYEIKPIYHTFEIAQTLRFKDVKDKVLSEMDDNAETLKKKMNNIFNGSTDDSNILNNQISNHSRVNKSIINGIYHLNQLISEKQDMSDNLEQSLHLLRLKNVPTNFNFNNASTNDGTSNLSNNSITNNNIGISSFNEPSLNINLKLSNLTNPNNQSLQNATFKINDISNLIYPNSLFNYRTVNNPENGYIQYGIYPITLNYTKGVMPSGTYTGTATWDISPKVDDNGITIK